MNREDWILLAAIALALLFAHFDLSRDDGDVVVESSSASAWHETAQITPVHSAP
jgi:hypothetical protein